MYERVSRDRHSHLVIDAVKALGIFALLLTSTNGGVCLAFASAPTGLEAGPMASDMGTAALKTVGSLILIIGLIVCAVYLLKRVRLMPFSHHKNPKLRIIETLNLAPRRSIALVEVCDQWLLLGVGVESVTLLSRLGERIQTPDSESIPQQGEEGFKALFERKINWIRKARETGGE